MASQRGATLDGKPPTNCPVCRKIIGVRQSDGLLRTHGPPNNHCPGSGGPAVGWVAPPPSHVTCPPDANQSLDLFDSFSVDTQSAPPPFRPTLPSGKILKRIPRGARDSAAAEFQQSLSGVVEYPEVEGNWKRLFAFAGWCLCQPADHRRGGKRVNLTSAVITQINAFTISKGTHLPAGGGRTSELPRKRPAKPIDADTSSARRAAAKMDEGDIKRAIWQLCSLDKLTSPSQQSYLDLLAKHPAAPIDRRSLSANNAVPISFCHSRPGCHQIIPARFSWWPTRFKTTAFEGFNG